MKITTNKFKELTDKMGMHSLVEYPRECCGIITKDFEYIPCSNISFNPKESFILDPLALLKYENNCWAVYHSHPGSENPIPSKEDISSSAFNEYNFVVGFGTKFYIYWWDSNIESLRFDNFEEKHCVSDIKVS